MVLWSDFENLPDTATYLFKFSQKTVLVKEHGLYGFSQKTVQSL